jgi:hypothetical protein
MYIFLFINFVKLRIYLNKFISLAFGNGDSVRAGCFGGYGNFKI